MSLLELFCDVDDFCQAFEPWLAKQQLEGSRGSKRGPQPRLSKSEIMTIVIHFHQAGYKTFKNYYQKHVCQELRKEFPELVSYNRFVELMDSVGCICVLTCEHALGAALASPLLIVRR